MKWNFFLKTFLFSKPIRSNATNQCLVNTVLTSYVPQKIPEMPMIFLIFFDGGIDTRIELVMTTGKYLFSWTFKKVLLTLNLLAISNLRLTDRLTDKENIYLAD